MKKAQVYFKNLDGIRFICFFTVFLFHSFAINNTEINTHRFYTLVKGLFAYGNLGVNFFFVLSGFLITYLLLVEKETYKAINIKAFYMRRVLRIWPLYYFCVLFGFFLFPLFKQMFGEVPNEPASKAMYFLFLSNFDYLRTHPDSSVLSVLWSVAIEEQFYLIWPLIIGKTPFNKLKFVFAAILCINITFRWLNLDNLNRLNIHTLSVMGDFIVGATAAYLAFFNQASIKKLFSLGRPFIWILYLTAAVFFFFKDEILHANSILLLAERLILSVVFALIILEQCYSPYSIFKFSKSPFLTKWGNYTYGLYCLHFIAILVVHTLIMKFNLDTNVYTFIGLEGSLSLIAAMGLAYLSYHFFEKPFLRLKEKFAVVRKESEAITTSHPSKSKALV